MVLHHWAMSSMRRQHSGTVHKTDSVSSHFVRFNLQCATKLLPRSSHFRTSRLTKHPCYLFHRGVFLRMMRLSSSWIAIKASQINAIINHLLKDSSDLKKGARLPNVKLPCFYPKTTNTVWTDVDFFPKRPLQRNRLVGHLSVNHPKYSVQTIYHCEPVRIFCLVKYLKGH